MDSKFPDVIFLNHIAAYLSISTKIFIDHLIGGQARNLLK